MFRTRPTTPACSRVERGQLESSGTGRLLLAARRHTHPLTRLTADDQFHASRPRFARFRLVFGRKPSNEDDESDGTSRPVVEVSWGDEWYAASTYEGPREFEVPDHWRSFVGHYRNENPWVGSLRVLILRGKLMLSVTYVSTP